MVPIVRPVASKLYVACKSYAQKHHKHSNFFFSGHAHFPKGYTGVIMKRAALLFMAICLLVAPAGFPPFTSRVWALEPTLETVNAWLQKEWELSKVLPDFGDKSILWDAEQYSDLSDAEFLKLKAEVSANPNHPRQGEFQVHQMYRTKGPTKIHYQLFVRGEGKWRINEQADGQGYHDQVFTGSSAWRLTPDLLDICDPSTESSDKNQAISGATKTFRPALCRLLHGGIGFHNLADLDIHVLEVHSNQWIAALERPSTLEPSRQLALRIAGTWDNEAQRGFINEIRITKNGAAPHSVGAKEIVTGWKRDVSAERWIASRVDIYNATGTLERAIVFRSIAPPISDGFQAVTRLPPMKGSDPLRGDLSFKLVKDFKKNTMGTRESPQSTFVESDMNPAVPQRYGWLKLTGWVILAVFAALFALLVAKRRTSSN